MKATVSVTLAFSYFVLGALALKNGEELMSTVLLATSSVWAVGAMIVGRIDR